MHTKMCLWGHFVDNRRGDPVLFCTIDSGYSELLNISRGVQPVGAAEMGTGKRNDLANAVAFMRLDECHHSLLADVAYPIAFAIERMHLRVCPKKIFEAIIENRLQ
jgi:hypothetical protein